MQINIENPKMKQSEKADQLGYSSSTLQRYRNDINMLSPYRIPPNSNKRKQKIPNHAHDLERPQMTSNDLKRPQMTSKECSPNIGIVKPMKNKLKAGGKNETNDEHLDGILHIINH